jgi:tetratricopeptide (TPR) repeat protein
MRLRCAFYVFILFSFLTQVACPQTKSPNAYRSTARGLAVGELFGVAESAEQGDAASQLLMGLSLQLVAERIEYDVEGRTGTLRLSAHWFREAAERNFAPAQYFLAATDLKLLENCDEIAPLLNKAIAQNYPPAITALGRRYMEGGCRFKVDYREGLQWLTKASDAGDADANYWIGQAYEQGRGVAPDQKEATKWFSKGARMGDPSSQNSFAINLAEGNGTRKDTAQAIDWFRKSAEQGNDEAGCNLALHHMRGEGVEKDYVLALMWGLISGRIATQMHCLSEIDTHDMLQMSAAQESEATQRANAWLKEHHYPITAPPKRIYPDKGKN